MKDVQKCRQMGFAGVKRREDGLTPHSAQLKDSWPQAVWEMQVVSRSN